MTTQPDLDNPFLAWDSGDLKKAFRLFLAHVRRGDRTFEINVGYCYDLGLGTRKDRDEAMRWYRRAYARGDSAAASNIATIYRDEGRHTLKFAWYQRAAALGDGDAQLEMAKCHLSGSGAPAHRGKAMTSLRHALKSSRITPDGRDESVRLLDACRK